MARALLPGEEATPLPEALVSSVLLFPVLLSLAAQAEDAPLKLGLSFQPRLTATLDGDPDASDQQAVTDAGLRVRRILVTVNGTLAERIEYRFRANLANAFSFTDADGKGQQASKPVLDDAQVVFRIADPLQVSAGQWKVPFTASQAMSDTTLLLPDRPIVLDGFKLGDVKVDGFSWSRDAGVAVQGHVAEKRLEYAVGAFNGDGQNTWPPTDEAPLLAGRVQVAPLGEMKYDEVDLARGAPRLAIGLSGAHEAPALFSDAGARDGGTSDLRAGADLRLTVRGLSVQAEGLYGRSQVEGVDEDVTRTGLYAQVGYCLPVGVAPGLRWSRLDPTTLSEDDTLSQFEGVLNWYLPDPAKEGGNLGHKAQLQLHWATTTMEGVDHPLAHQVQLAAAVGI